MASNEQHPTPLPAPTRTAFPPRSRLAPVSISVEQIRALGRQAEESGDHLRAALVAVALEDETSAETANWALGECLRMLVTP